MNLVSNWASRQRNNTLSSFAESDESGTDSSFSSSEDSEGEGDDWQLDTSEQVEMFKRCVRLPEFLLTH